MIVQTQTGVPALLGSDFILVPLTQMTVGNIVAEELEQPGVIDMLMQRVKIGVQDICGLDSTMPTEEWWIEFHSLLLINEFQPALHALRQAKDQADNLRREMTP